MKPAKPGAGGDGVATPSNPGTSINFDAQALHDAEEAEYQREEHERQQELHALLTNAFDDLSEDEDLELSQNSSHFSHALSQNSSHLSHASFSQDPNAQHAQHTHNGHNDNGGDLQQQNPMLNTWPPSYGMAYTSTTAADMQPTQLVSPATAQYQYGYHANTDYPDNRLLAGHEGGEPYSGGYGGGYWEGESQQPEQQVPAEDLDYGERGEIEGATEEDMQYQDAHHQQYADYGFQPAGVGYHDDQPAYQYHDLGNNGHKSAFHEVGVSGDPTHDHQALGEPTQDHPSLGYTDHREIQQQPGNHGNWRSPGHRDTQHQHEQQQPGNWHSPGHHEAQQQQHGVWKSPGHLETQQQHGSHQEATDWRSPGRHSPQHQHQHQQPGTWGSPSKTEHGTGLDNYRVNYQRSAEGRESSGQDRETQRDDTGHSAPGRDAGSLQQDFLNQVDGSSEGRQLAQLQILYKARGQQLKESRQSLQALRDDSDRQIRILKHQLTLAEDERGGATHSRDQCQDLLTESKHRESQLQGQVAALQAEVNVLRNGKQELIQKLETAESTIESLNAQLLELGSSETLSRAKDQHHAVVSGMKHKYEQEILLLKEQLDASHREREEQMADISQLKKQLLSETKAGEDAHIERADTINRLSRSLEESQRQCQELLEAGTGQEVGKLKLKLQDVIAGRSIAEDMNTALQDEIKELKEQVSLYETASNFGVYPTGNKTAQKHYDHDPDDSYAQLGIKKSMPPPMWKTPDNSTLEADTLSSEETVHGLKHELERCLEMYRNKRLLVSQLQQEVKDVKFALEETKHKLEQAKKEVSENKQDSLSDSGNVSVREAHLVREMEKISQDKQVLQEELQEVKRCLEEVAASEEQVNDLNRELSSQMSQMVRDFDEDKRQALEKCQDACLKLQEDSKDKLRQELQAQCEHDQETYMQEHREETSKIKEELKMCQEELDQVKELYVNVCRVKDDLEDMVNQEWEVKLEQQLTQLRDTLTKEKDAEILQLKQTLSSSSEVTMTMARDQWRKEQEEETARTIESQVAAARVKWFQEHQVSKDTAVQAAVRKTDADWQSKWETQWSTELEQAKSEWQSDQQQQLETELSQRLADAKQAWTQTDLQSAIEEAKLTWMDTELTQKLAEAKDTWTHTELKAAVEEAQQTSAEADYSQRLAEAKQTWTQTDLKAAVEQAQAELSQTAALARQTETQALFTEAHKQELEALRSQIGQKVSLERALSEAEESWTAERQQLTAEIAQLRQQLSGHQEAWLAEKQQVVREKDKERRLAVEEVQTQCERDYKDFLEEHQNTLNNALKSARQQHEAEKAEMEQRHEDELRSLREKKDQTEGSTADFTKERQDLEAQWQQERTQTLTEWEDKLEALKSQYEIEKSAMASQYETDKSALMQMHRDKLSQALQEAKSKWRKKSDDQLGAPDSRVVLERERQWAKERSELLSELQDREQLLQSADQHMEAEINKLQAELQWTHEEKRQKLQLQHQEELQAELEKLQLTNENQLQAEIKKLQQTHEQRLQSELEKLKLAQQQLQNQLKKLQLTHKQQLQQLQLTNKEQVQQLQDTHAANMQEKKELEKSLKAVKGQLKDMEVKYSTEVSDNRESIKGMEAQLLRVSVQLQEQIQLSQTSEKQKQDLQLQLTEGQHSLQKAEKQRQEVVKNYAKAEAEHAQIVDANRQRQQELSEKLLKLQTQYKMLEAKARKHIGSVQESLEREQTVALDKLKEKMLEMRNSHTAAMEKLRKEHSVQMVQLQQKVKELSQSTREMTHTPTQTDQEHVETDALRELHGQYVEAVTRIKADVLQHSLDSTDAVSDSITVEVIKERQATARRLRKYYLRCYSQMLEKEFDSSAKAEKMTAMKEALDSIPERDSSCGTSRTNTPASDVLTSYVHSSQIRPITPIQADPSSGQLEEGWVTPRLSKNSPRNRNVTSSVDTRSTGKAGSQSQPRSASSGQQSWGTTPEITPRSEAGHQGGRIEATPPTSSTPTERSSTVDGHTPVDGLYFQPRGKSSQSGQTVQSVSKQTGTRSAVNTADNSGLSSPVSISSERDYNYNNLNKTIDTLDREKTPTNEDNDRGRHQCKSADMLRSKPRLTVASQSGAYKYTSLRTSSPGAAPRTTLPSSVTRRQTPTASRVQSSVSRGSQQCAASSQVPSSFQSFQPVTPSTTESVYSAYTPRHITVVSKQTAAPDSKLYKPTPMVTRTTQAPSPVHVTSRPVNRVR